MVMVVTSIRSDRNGHEIVPASLSLWAMYTPVPAMTGKDGGDGDGGRGIACGQE
ncbi:hypothetical protein PYCC9005_003588 [Savitreella phatthalungensis]